MPTRRGGRSCGVERTGWPRRDRGTARVMAGGGVFGRGVGAAWILLGVSAAWAVVTRQPDAGVYASYAAVMSLALLVDVLAPGAWHAAPADVVAEAERVLARTGDPKHMLDSQTDRAYNDAHPVKRLR